MKRLDVSKELIGCTYPHAHDDIKLTIKRVTLISNMPGFCIEFKGYKNGTVINFKEALEILEKKQ